jgi:hypothetical protein
LRLVLIGFGALSLRCYSLISRFASILVCLLLLVAAVDTIPDPEAITSLSSHGSDICACHLHVSSARQLKEQTLLASLPNRLNWFFWMSAFDAQPQGRLNLPRVQHAADSSPPVLS